MSLRYVAQRYKYSDPIDTSTWEYLHNDIPIDCDGPEWVLSSYGVMHGTISPDNLMLNIDQTRAMFEPWSTLIHVEHRKFEDSQYKRIWTGIVTNAEIDGAVLDLTIEEFPVIARDAPVEVRVRGVNTYATVLLQELWDNFSKSISFPTKAHTIGSPAGTHRIGTNSDDAVRNTRRDMLIAKGHYDASPAAVAETLKKLSEEERRLSLEVRDRRKDYIENLKTYQEIKRPTNAASSWQVTQARNRMNTAHSAWMDAKRDYNKHINGNYHFDGQHQKVKRSRDHSESLRNNYNVKKDAYEAAKETLKNDGGPYLIEPKDNGIVANEFDKLCAEDNIEWVTDIHLGNDNMPRIGLKVNGFYNKREDIIFELGGNVVSDLHLKTNDKEYANAIIGIGGGEGSKSIKQNYELPVPDSLKRIRRVAVYQDRSVKNESELLNKIKKEIKKHHGLPYVHEITVVDSSLAPFFTTNNTAGWKLGDIVTVRGMIPHYGKYEEWHRIIGWRLLDENTAVIQLELYLD